ncbi:DUF1642 domain-containing protein [Streptococcus pneumoniae]|nr:DUF1642 domain-containing protein [Streptococcus pneumoniae]
MNKDLIETPRFNFFIGDEVLLKGKIVGFDVDENKCVENVVRLEYGQTLNVPNNNIYITDDIVDKSKIKVVVPQCVADWYEANKDNLDYNIWEYIYEWDNQKKSEFKSWFGCSREAFKTLVNMNQFGYEVEEEKRYLVTLKNRQPLVKSQSGSTLYFSQDITARNYKGTQKELEDAKFGWVFDCEGIEIEEVE